MRSPVPLLLVAVCVASTVSCSTPPGGRPANTAGQASRAPTAEPTYTPTATIKDLMDSMIDPAGDLVWNATATVVDQKGETETRPISDDDWQAVKRGAVMLLEGANLLQMPGRHMARPGERSETPGVELEPAEMEGLVTKNRAEWNGHAQDLHAAGLEVLQAVEAKDAQKVFEAGGRLDSACESCHRAYWYPNEKIPDFPSDIATKGVAR